LISRRRGLVAARAWNSRALGRMGREITQELLVAVTAKSQIKPRANEPIAKFLARITHLHLNDRKLTSSALPAGCCAGLKALYLFDNEIEVLDGLCNLTQLTHLYCQNNAISRIVDDVGTLTRLRKLYLNGNCLSSLETLAPLAGLEELHASSQRLPDGAMLDLAPGALSRMSGLKVLALANNGLRSVNDLACCRSLQTVDLAKNQLSTISSLLGLIGASPISDLDLRDNDVSDSRQELDAIIVRSASIKRLNGRDLMSSERPYLTQLARIGARPTALPNAWRSDELLIQGGNMAVR